MIGEGNTQDDYILKSEANFHSRKHITCLFKNFLGILETLQKEHTINFDKLEKSVPQEFKSLVDMANYFDQNRFSFYRKKVLDAGGEAIRNLEKDFDVI